MNPALYSDLMKTTTTSMTHPTGRKPRSDIPTLTCYGQIWSETPVLSRLGLWHISDGVNTLKIPKWPADESVIRDKIPKRTGESFTKACMDISQHLQESPQANCDSCEERLRPDGTCQNRSGCFEYEYCDNFDCPLCWHQCWYCGYSSSDGGCEVEDCPSHEPNLITAAETVTGPPWFKQAFDITGPPWFTKPFLDRKQWHIT